MTTTALSCGNANHSPSSIRDGVRWVEVSSTPGKAEVDPLLEESVDRLVVHGTDADLAAVIVRLLRKERLATITVGYLPVWASPASKLWGIAPGSEIAFTGEPRPAALIRDDAGGVLVGAGTITPITGQVYCEDQLVLTGSALAVEVGPDPDATPLPEPTADPNATLLEPAEDGLRVTVRRRGLLRQRRETTRGRAVQANMRSTEVTLDGRPHPRPARTWGWYRHTEDLQLIR